jgi:hypothetical protein
MSNFCPNIKSKEFEALEARYGLDLSYKLYWLNKNNIPSLERAKEIIGKTNFKDDFILPILDDSGNYKVYDPSFKKELFEGLELIFLNSYNAEIGDYDLLFSKKISSNQINEIFNKSLDIISKGLLGNLQNFKNELSTESTSAIKSFIDSLKNEEIQKYIQQLLFENIAKYGISVKTKVQENKIEENDEDSGKEFGEIPSEEQEEAPSSRDSLSIDHAIYYNTKSSFPKAVKLLLASISELKANGKNKLSPSMNLPYRDYGLEVYLLNRLADVPWNITDQMKVLVKLQDERPSIKKLIQKLGGEKYEGNNYSILKLRQQFSQAFGKHKYELFITEIKNDGGIRVFNSNQDSVENKLRKTWESRLLVNLNKHKDKSPEELAKYLESLNSEQTRDFLGISVVNQNLFDRNTIEGGQQFYSESIEASNFSVAIDKIKDKIVTSLKNKEFKLANIYKTTREKSFVSGFMKDIIKYAAQYEDPTDLQIRNSEGKTVYSINLHTYQSLVTTLLNYSMNESDQEKRIEYLNNELPFIMNAYTENSVWLNQVIKNNIGITPVLLDGLTSNTTNTHLSNAKPTDLSVVFINALLNDIYPAIKHSDRGMFPAYKVRMKNWTSDLVDSASTSIIKSGKYWIGTPVDKFKDVLVNYIWDEVQRYNLKNKINIDNYNTGSKPNINESFILDGLKLSLFTKEEVTNKDKFLKRFQAGDLSLMLTDYINNYLDETINQAKELKVLSMAKKTDRQTKEKYDDKQYGIAGIDNNIFQKFKKFNATDDAAAQNIVAYAALKYWIGAHEQFKLFLGDPALYKIKGNIFDLAKRANMQSSSKNTTAVDQETNAWIENKNRQDEIFDPKTGSFFTYKNGKADGTLTELVVADDDFFTALDDQMKTLYANNPEKYEAYKKFTENDGISVINMFALREFQHRRGDYTNPKDRNFQLQLKIINEVFNIDSKEERKKRISNILKVEVNFEKINEYRKNGNVSIFTEKELSDFKLIEQYINANGFVDWESFYKETYGSFVVEKPQYVGPNYLMPLDQYKNLDPKNRINVTSGRKTSYLPLIPTLIEGTVYEDVLMFMLRNGVDVIHFNSAAKFGGKKTNNNEFRKFYKTVTNEQGEVFTNGFNDENFDETQLGYLDYRFLGKQQEIHEEIKNKNTVSSQDRKNKFFGIMENGIPIDYTGTKEEWENLSDEDKMKNSELYNNVAISIISQNIKIRKMLDDFKNELSINPDFSFSDYAKSINVLIEQAKDRNSPDNILDSLRNWVDDNGVIKYIETLPNYRSIQFILNSLLSNRVLKEKRSGTSVPQIPSTGFEEKGTMRRIVDGKIESQTGNNAVVNYYQTDENNILKPAEIIMPLPHYWIGPLYQKYKKYVKPGDIKGLIDAVNRDIENNKLDTEVTFKALRIPHQQLSSTDIVKVKKFLLPYVQSGVIVPSELVVKTGGDFDIDKLNIYFPELDNNFNVIEYQKDKNGNPDLNYYLNAETDNKFYEELDNLSLENDIKMILHRLRYERFLSPIADYPLEELKNKVKESAKKLKRSHMFEFNSLVEQTERFLAGKEGVGILATWVTFSSLAQIHDLYIDNNIFNQLHFEGYENNYSLAYTKAGEHFVDDVLSALLTSQVDLVKDPYAKDLMLTTATLNIVSYLVIRGVPINKIVNMLTNPVISNYIKARNINESETSKSSGIKINSKEEFINDYTSNLEESDKYLLNAFLGYEEQTKLMKHLKDYITADTKFHKNLEAIDMIESNLPIILAPDYIVKNVDKLINNSILTSFIEGRQAYLKIYNRLYLSRNGRVKQALNSIKSRLAPEKKGLSKDERERISLIISDEFVNYIVQTQNSLFKTKSFEILQESLPGKFKKFVDDNKDINLLAKEIIPIQPNGEYDIYKLRLFRNNMTTPEVNLLSAFFSNLRTANQDLHDDIVIYNIFTNGISPSPFQLNKIIPEKSQRKIFDKLNSLSDINLNEEIFKDFFNRLILARPDILQTYKNSYRNSIINKANNIYIKMPINQINIDGSKALLIEGKIIKPIKDYNNQNASIYFDLYENYTNFIFSGLNDDMINMENTRIASNNVIDIDFEEVPDTNVTEPTTPTVSNVEITKINYTKDTAPNNPNTGFIFTENAEMLDTNKNVSMTQAIIRTDKQGNKNLNALPIITKKLQVAGEAGQWKNTEEDFNEFKRLNTILIGRIKSSNFEKYVFPQGFATEKAKLPTRFAEWLQKELLDNFGLVTELNSAKTGLISKSIRTITPTTPQAVKAVDTETDNNIGNIKPC